MTTSPSSQSEIERLIRKAIAEKLVVHIRYTSQYGGHPHRTSRDIEPLEIRSRMVSAYCRLRQAGRTFRLDRVESARLTGEQFSPRSGMGTEASAGRSRNPKDSEGCGCWSLLFIVILLIVLSMLLG